VKRECDVARVDADGRPHRARSIAAVPDNRVKHGAARIVDRAFGGATIVRDGQVSAAASAWYAPRPATPDGWLERADAVRSTVSPNWRASLDPALAAAGAAAARLERAAGGRGVVVTTGQQPGLFGGPLYTWWKALTALALADALESATGVPHAPVFWAATDDSDFAESAETFVAIRGGLDRLALAPRPTHGERLIDVPLGDVEPLLARLAAGAGAAVNPAALDAVAEAYRGDATTIGGAYLALLRRVLEPLGIAVLDAAHPAVRAAGAPLLRDALREAGAIEQALSVREQALRAAGVRPQVPLVRGRSLVFATANGVRERIAIPAAARIADSGDESLGPNVLLRPVMERAILPTTAYVAGPGELAYFAQVSAVADALGAEVPLALPRWSGTVIEPHAQRLLERYDLSLDALQDPHAAEGVVARGALPANVRSALERLRDVVLAPMQALASAVGEAGAPTLPSAVLTGAARDVERRLARLERRIIAAAKREHTAAMTDLASLRAALVPAGKPQERMLNLFPLLARHGPVLLDDVRAAARRHAEAIIVRGAPPDPEPQAAHPSGTGARERAT
jgi:bacillithiol biosynthesis cysteine-adding enzyme BshC